MTGGASATGGLATVVTGWLSVVSCSESGNRVLGG